jgi:hypothetical protein
VRLAINPRFKPPPRTSRMPNFQTVEVAFAGSCLLKDMLSHFQRRDGRADEEASIRNNFIQPCRKRATVGTSNFCFKLFIDP